MTAKKTAKKKDGRTAENLAANLEKARAKQRELAAARASNGGNGSKSVEVYKNGELVDPSAYELKFKKQKAAFERKLRRVAKTATSRLEKIIESSHNHMSVVAATKIVFDRAYGAPDQHINHSGTIQHVDLAQTLRLLNDEMKKSETIVSAEFTEVPRIEQRNEPGDDTPK